MNMYTRRECISIGICFVRSSVPIHIYIFLSSRGISRIEGKNKKGVHESNIYGARAEGAEICVGFKDSMPSRSRSISSPKSIHYGAWVRLVLLIVNTDAILSSS